MSFKCLSIGTIHFISWEVRTFAYILFQDIYITMNTRTKSTVHKIKIKE